VLLDLGHEIRGNGAVEEVGKFCEEVCAGHRDAFFSLSAAGEWAGFCLKYRLSRSRS
jgi:hypothetical protein